LRYPVHEEHQGDLEAKYDAPQKLKHHDAGCRGTRESSPTDGHQIGQLQKDKYKEANTALFEHSLAW